MQRDDAAGILSLSTPYCTIEHDLRKGGAISCISLRYGRAANLLVHPIGTRVREENGTELTDLGDRAPKVKQSHAGLYEIVTVEAAFVDPRGHTTDLRVRTTFEYRWGYIKIHKEFLLPIGGFRFRELCPISTILAPSLSDYGYREGITEDEGAPPFSFGDNRWGRLRPGQSSDPPLQTRYVPRSMIFVDPGVEGLEWFVGSDLSQWELEPAGGRSQGRCSLQPNQDPPGLALSISPLWMADAAMLVPAACAFDFYIAFPILEGHAHRPWIHTSFNRNRGNLQHNFYRGQSEFGVQMCLRSGWLDFLKFSIDRVLKNHPLDGVYFDWNVALFCRNPLHGGKGADGPARDHWDMDELLDLMEWARKRVGPNGLIIVHNTMVPMFSTENFADYVVATEWGYQKWTDRAPDLQDLPLEWSLAGARSRGVISYGTIDEKAPRRLHKLFALEAFLGGVAPWPAGRTSKSSWTFAGWLGKDSKSRSPATTPSSSRSGRDRIK